MDLTEHERKVLLRHLGEAHRRAFADQRGMDQVVLLHAMAAIEGRTLQQRIRSAADPDSADRAEFLEEIGMTDADYRAWSQPWQAKTGSPR